VTWEDVPVTDDAPHSEPTGDLDRWRSEQDQLARQRLEKEQRLAADARARELEASRARSQPARRFGVGVVVFFLAGAIATLVEAHGGALVYLGGLIGVGILAGGWWYAGRMR
jgi:hypothetical protein